jgi:hypothetical protein
MADLNDYPELERRESAADEELARRQLFEAFAMVETLQAAFEDYAVQPGTELAGDDDATPYESLSSQIETNIAVSFDNLRTVKLIMQDARTVPAFAHFGLVRNAVEAAGIGLWQLGPDSRDERVLRSLQISFEGRKDIHGLEAAMDASFSRLPSTDPATLRLEEIRDARPTIRGLPLRPPPITDRLKGAQDYARDSGDFSLLVTWKMTSGIAHGQRSALYAMLDRELISTNEVGARVNMTSSISTIAGTYKLALHYLMDLLMLLLNRNGTPISLPDD